MFLFKSYLYLGMIGGLLLAIPILIQPRWGFYLTVAAIPLDDVGKLGNILPFVDITIAKILALLTIASWILHLAMRKVRFIWSYEIGIFLFYFLIAVLSLADALELKRGLQELIILGTTIVFFTMVFNLLTQQKHIMIALTLFTIVSVGTFGYAVVQRFLPGTQIAERIGWLEEGEATHGVEISNIESQSLGGTVMRSTGTTAHSNVLAANTAFLVPILFAFLRFSHSRWLRLSILASFGICISAAVVSLSRTGILAFAIILPQLIYFRLIKVTSPRIAVVLIAAIISIPFLPEGVSRIFNPTNYFSSQSVSVSERYKLWDAATKAFFDNPLSGFGVGNNRGILEYYLDAPWNPGLLTVHNSYLQIAIETGIFGLLCMLYFLIRIFRKLSHARRIFIQYNDDWGAAFATSLRISFISFLIIGALAFDFMRIGFKNMWFFIGCSIALYRIALLQLPGRTT